MPVYEYRCAACGQAFSRYFKSQRAAAGPVACSQCGAAEVERTVSRFQLRYSLQSQIDRIDPAHEQELEWADRHHQATDPLKRINLDFDPKDE
jgi:putative FmdB family regulatory protein